MVQQPEPLPRSVDDESFEVHRQPPVSQTSIHDESVNQQSRQTGTLTPLIVNARRRRRTRAKRQQWRVRAGAGGGSTARSVARSMGCCCSTPVPIVWAGYDVSSYDAGDRYRVERVDSDAHAHWEATVDVLARAFCGTESAAPEPVNTWIYNGGTELGPLAAAPTELRAGWFKWALALCAHMCLNVGGVYALVEKTTGQVVAATGVMPPGARSASDMSMGGVLCNHKETG